MKHFTCITLLVIVSCAFCAEAEAQMAVKDKNKNYQLEREVFIRWNEFRPKWYFWLFHRKYDDVDRRNILQLAPWNYSSGLWEQRSENQKLNTDTLFNQKTNEALLRETGLVWTLYFEKKFSQADRIYATEVGRLQLVAPQGMFIHAGDLRNSIMDQVRSLREGYLMPGDLREGLQAELDKYHDLNTEIRKVTKMLTSINNYSN